eukprot:6214821-Pleurochrysis_carterae.AAC.1
MQTCHPSTPPLLSEQSRATHAGRASEQKCWRLSVRLRDASAFRCPSSAPASRQPPPDIAISSAYLTNGRRSS